MIDRQSLKYNAKQELKNYYWLAVAVSFVASILSGSNFQRIFNLNNYSNGLDSAYTSSYNSYYYSIAAASAYLSVTVFMTLLVIAFSIFVGNIIAVGQCAFYIRAPYGDRRFSNLFFAFRNGNFGKVAMAQFKTNLVIFGWSLLLIVPGIIKSYEYRMVPYLLAENPDLTANECMMLSRQMTMNKKMDMFVLDLSFIGWYMLGAILCGVGIIFVTPYYQATYAQLYFSMRAEVPIPPPANPGPFENGAFNAPYPPPPAPPFNSQYNQSDINGYNNTPYGQPNAGVNPTQGYAAPPVSPEPPAYYNQPVAHGQNQAPYQPEQASYSNQPYAAPQPQATPPFTAQPQPQAQPFANQPVPPAYPNPPQGTEQAPYYPVGSPYNPVGAAPDAAPPYTPDLNTSEDNQPSQQ